MLHDKQVHVVVVDDEVEITNTLSEILLELGYKCSSFNDATKALDFLLSDSTVDLLITDLRMPKMDGFSLIKSISNVDSFIPIIIITAYGDIDITIKALRSGASDYFPKPFDFKEVEKSIKRIIEQNFRHTKLLETSEFLEKTEHKFKIRADKLDYAQISKFLSEYLYNLGYFNLNDKLNYGIAIYEALVNANEHGNLELNSKLKESEFEGKNYYQEERSKKLKMKKYLKRYVSINFKTDQKKAIVEIKDNGKGFDVKKITDIDPLEIFMNEQNHGRGITLIKLYSDEVSFNDKGNKIKIVKYKSDL
jgi:FixJ family two-component response regulator/anti-sigma regulatory factor (Ser/Thr protein kinase)